MQHRDAGQTNVLKFHKLQDRRVVSPNRPHLLLEQQQLNVLALQDELRQVAGALQTVQVSLHLSLPLHVLHEFLAIGGVQLVHESFLFGANFSDELYGCIVNALLGALEIRKKINRDREKELLNK